MANIETLKVNTFNFEEGSAPSTPSSGQSVVYANATGLMMAKTDAGTEHLLAFSGASVYHDATQSINNDTATALAFNTERFDTDAYHDSGSNTRMTIPTGFTGIYQYGATVRFAADADGYRTLTVRKNGTDFLNGFMRVPTAGSGTDTSLTVVGIWSLAAADYIEVVVRHLAGAALNVEAGSSTSGAQADFWIVRLR